ncbi:MAG TPA: preprotein translocase subunit SecY [Ginsengibacter sp.]|nr:preprotein translocase subunit SecY [Chitinophagaceae bacterium]MCZ2396991.1 preprotein translocase subunit SecY [Chitinophagales bacterium]HRN72966.1 preprotein translocase subunit SecY [Ginsengibacter sp.]MCO5285160.1 preprotein translocase subunit SecY [Chitinophagaceae bacterium]MCW5913200.1 preprotein translocase subunit SecY [Chitinophagaceae bacterium]
MKKFIKTLKNIWTIEELRNKIVYTLLLIFVYRIGSFIVLPGIDPNQLSNLEASTRTGMLGLLDAFVGGAFSKASIFALGIMPYISASIFIQLVTILVPSITKIQKEGESGQRKINQWTRYLTIIVTAFQAAAYIGFLKSTNREAMLPAYEGFFWVSTVIILTVGTLFVMWLGEKITDKGIGNGISLIIMIGILARLPQSFAQEFAAKQTQGGLGLLKFTLEIAAFIAVILGLIVLVQGVRKVPVNYAKQIVGNRQFGGARQFLPLKVNAAGVMPIIFAQAIMFLPTIFVGFQTSGKNWAKYFTDPKNGVYMLVYGLMTVAFTFIYTALIFNPKQMSEDLKRSNGFIPGVKPGKPTTDYIGTIMDRITLPGSILLGVVGILPGLVELFGVTQGFATFYGGTSLLIMVAVVLDTLQQIETQLLMRQYDGLMSSGRIQGRQGTAAPGVTGGI